MKLKKLEIFGFKSFVDKACIEFPPGVSAVVGPNGCGKSNVFDALRWVMGEQSVKQLRGKAMGDIIFAGTSGKPPLNLAEVSLTLRNDDGSVPEELKDFSEIMITRRLYRSGESAYFINKRPCRLKDIHHVFLGSGLGAKSYAIIQQGRIGAITDAGPDERRFFIEEAAGVTRYKQRKDEALRKLKATEQNLLRVNDIVAEVERQMGGLKRQAKKADLFNRCQEQITQLDVRLTVHQCEEISRQAAETRTLLTHLKDTDMAHNSELKKLDAALEAIKLARTQKNQLISDQKSRKFDAQRQIDKAENDREHLRRDIDRLGNEIASLRAARDELVEKNRRMDGEINQVATENAELCTALESVKVAISREQTSSQAIRETLGRLNRELEAGKRRLLDLSAREARYQNVFQHATTTKESLKRRLRRADEQAVLVRRKVEEAQQLETVARQDLADCRGILEDLKARISVAQKTRHEQADALAAQVKTCQTLQLERKTCVSKYNTLKKMEESLEWYKDGVKAILKYSAARNGGDETVPSAALGGVLGIVADVVDPAPSYEMAVEAVFGESLQYILVSDPEAGRGAIDYLQRSGEGRGGFVPVSAVKAVVNGGSSGPDAERRLLNHVTVKSGYEHVAEAMLGHVAVTQDLSEAMALYHRNGAVQTVVTKDGDVVSHQGIMIGGSRENLAGILLKKKELKTLQQQISHMDEAQDRARRSQNDLESRMRDAEIRLQQLIAQQAEAARDELAAEKQLYTAGEDVKNARRHLDVVELEQEQLLGEESDVAVEITRHRKELAETSEKIKTVQTEIDGLSREIISLSEQIEAFDQRIVDCKLERTSLQARLENSENTLRRLADFQRDGQQRLEQLVRDIDTKTGRQIAAKEKVGQTDLQLASWYEEMEELARVLDDNEIAYASITAEMKDKDSIFNDIQGKREKTVQKIRMLEVEQSQRDMRLENMMGRMEERYQRSFDELKTQSHTGDNESPEQMEAALARLRQRLKSIGEVNPGAIREFDAQKQRYEFLVIQRDDLNQALHDLRKVIHKINRVTQVRFLKTLSEVNEKLTTIFPRLFEGGSAELVLTQPNEPLESGLEFMCHPPGKKVTRLSLLSGGEKALSAIAFIFSIFLIKPAAFCLMDEIDAPLDESNVFRFNELLRIIGEESQIVMITHNKRSMEFADTLFGITMERKGISKVVSVNLERRDAA